MTTLFDSANQFVKCSFILNVIRQTPNVTNFFFFNLNSELGISVYYSLIGAFMYCLSTCLFFCRHAKHGSVFDLSTVVKPMFSVRFGLIVLATDIWLLSF